MSNSLRHLQLVFIIAIVCVTCSESNSEPPSPISDNISNRGNRKPTRPPMSDNSLNAPQNASNTPDNESIKIFSSTSTYIAKLSNSSTFSCQNGDNTSKETLQRDAVELLRTLPTSQNSSTAECPPEGELPMRILGAFVSYVFLSVGTIGNLCVIAVVMKTKSLRRHPTNWYLASVALADFIILWSAAFPTILEYQTAVGEWVFGGRVGCSAAVFLQYLGINVSSIFIMTFSLERYVAICHPMKAMVLCTVSRAKRIVALVWLFGTIYCAPWLFLTTTIPLCHTPNVTMETNDDSLHSTTLSLLPTTFDGESSGSVRLECTFKLKRSHYTIYYMADFIIFYIIPLASTCALYVLIARAIRFSRGVDKPSMLSQERNQDQPIQQQQQPRWSKGLKYFTSRVQVSLLMINNNHDHIINY